MSNAARRLLARAKAKTDIGPPVKIPKKLVEPSPPRVPLSNRMNAVEQEVDKKHTEERQVSFSNKILVLNIRYESKYIY